MEEKIASCSMHTIAHQRFAIARFIAWNYGDTLPISILDSMPPHLRSPMSGGHFVKTRP